eukprot:413402-Hanusia_phi.AAC.2
MGVPPQSHWVKDRAEGSAGASDGGAGQTVRGKTRWTSAPLTVVVLGRFQPQNSHSHRQNVTETWRTRQARSRGIQLGKLSAGWYSVWWETVWILSVPLAIFVVICGRARGRGGGGRQDRGGREAGGRRQGRGRALGEEEQDQITKSL